MFQVETVNMKLKSVAVVCLFVFFSHVSDFSVECGPELKTHRIFLVMCTIIQLSLFMFIERFCGVECWLMKSGVSLKRVSFRSFSAGRLTEKAKQERKRLQNVYIFVYVNAGNQNVRETESVLSLEVIMESFRGLTKLVGGKLKLSISRSVLSRRGRQQILPFIQKWQLRLLSSVASCYIKRKNK